MRGLFIRVYYEQQDRPNSYERNNMLPYVATIHGPHTEHDIPTNGELREHNELHQDIL